MSKVGYLINFIKHYVKVQVLQYLGQPLICLLIKQQGEAKAYSFIPI